MKSAASVTALMLLFTGCNGGGGPPPDFTLQDIDGNTVTLSELRGKAVLIDFWFLA